MLEQMGSVLMTTVSEILETVHSERVTVPLPSPAKYIYETKLKNCLISSRVIKKSVQIKCIISLNTIYIEEKTMALRLFSWDWEITVFIVGQQTFSGAYSKTKLLNDSIIHSMLASPGELVLDTRLHFTSSILRDEIVSPVQAESGPEKVDSELASPHGGQEVFVQGVGTIQFEIE